jgi:hypothetical protein
LQLETDIDMSKQLAISAAFSVFATAAFALFAAPLETPTGARAHGRTGHCPRARCHAGPD